MSPGTSVVVPSRGGAQRLPVLLDALTRQQNCDFEVIVVIDGDIDGSEAVTRRWSGALRLRTISLPRNHGRAVALNTGFHAATGEVLVRCDDDLVPAADFVALHTAHHAGASVGVVGLYRNEFPETAYARVYGREWDTRFRDDAYRAGTADRWRYWAGNVSVHRQAWQRVGDYDPAFRGYGWEDVDWGFRLSRLGIPVVLDPRLETTHRIAATTCAVRAQRAFHSGAAKTRFDAKHDLAGPVATARTPWNRLVDVLARRQHEETDVHRWARAVDAVIPYLPKPFAHKLVALLVESSSMAGQHGPAGVTTLI